MKKEKVAVIVHRWEGNPKGDWYPALKKVLEKNNYRVLVPKMPHPAAPNMHAWISKLNAIIPNPSRETLLIGHSIGCQTILRWLSMLPKKEKVGNVLLVAPWMKLRFVEKEAKEIARPWTTIPIAWKMVKPRSAEFTCIFSDDDPYVAVNQAKIFKKELGAKIHIEKKKEHFTSAKDAVTIAEFL
jgi:predicted alpha/beta hydrolase family esterase